MTILNPIHLLITFVTETDIDSNDKIVVEIVQHWIMIKLVMEEMLLLFDSVKEDEDEIIVLIMCLKMKKVLKNRML